MCGAMKLVLVFFSVLQAYAENKPVDGLVNRAQKVESTDFSADLDDTVMAKDKAAPAPAPKRAPAPKQQSSFEEWLNQGLANLGGGVTPTRMDTRNSKMTGARDISGRRKALPEDFQSMQRASSPMVAYQPVAHPMGMAPRLNNFGSVRSPILSSEQVTESDSSFAFTGGLLGFLAGSFFTFIAFRLKAKGAESEYVRLQE